ncbi:glycosyltransferase [Gordonia hankookensis]|uniref:Glycosyltransferase n=1 Tax=Gordonia hankookensis TaxID=589403 RepID=A0ABR7W8C1_9ACTN|nr:glycosyltransferase [Gordonia hankookensis]MBD1319023.1 glycosyltransferase [Gordonia hankookensis]
MTSRPQPGSLSVIMPSFNPGPYLLPAIRSVLAQLGVHDELVVQDAFSTDGSRECLEAIGRQDARVRCVFERDSGQSDALNRCLDRAIGEWTIWLNADDVVVDGGVAAIRRVIRSCDDIDVIIGGHQIIRADGSLVDNYSGHLLRVDRLVVRGCSAFSGSIAMKTEFLRSVGGFDNHLHAVMDLELQFRMAARLPRQVVIPEPVGALRFHEGSKTANVWAQFVRESHRVRLSYADSWRIRARGLLATAIHVATRPVFRLRLTAGYRRARRLLVRAGSVTG